MVIQEELFCGLKEQKSKHMDSVVTCATTCLKGFYFARHLPKERQSGSVSDQTRKGEGQCMVQGGVLIPGD
jgi:hypothetical protein